MYSWYNGWWMRQFWNGVNMSIELGRCWLAWLLFVLSSRPDISYTVDWKLTIKSITPTFYDCSQPVLNGLLCSSVVGLYFYSWSKQTWSFPQQKNFSGSNWTEEIHLWRPRMSANHRPWRSLLPQVAAPVDQSRQPPTKLSSARQLSPVTSHACFTWSSVCDPIWLWACCLHLSRIAVGDHGHRIWEPGISRCLE